MKINLLKNLKTHKLNIYQLFQFYKLLTLDSFTTPTTLYKDCKYSLIITFTRKQFFVNLLNNFNNKSFFNKSFFQTLKFLKISNYKNNYSNLVKFFSFLKKQLKIFKINYLFYIILKIKFKKYLNKDILNEINNNINFNYLIYKNNLAFSKSTLKKKKRIKKRIKKRLIKEY